MAFLFFENSVSTLRAAIELKAVFDQIQAAEKAGNLSPEEKKRLEEQAAEKGLQALFMVKYLPPVPQTSRSYPFDGCFRARNSKWSQSFAKHVSVY